MDNKLKAFIRQDYDYYQNLNCKLNSNLAPVSKRARWVRVMSVLRTPVGGKIKARMSELATSQTANILDDDSVLSDNEHADNNQIKEDNTSAKYLYALVLLPVGWLVYRLLK